jgi:hypothetical protein
MSEDSQLPQVQPRFSQRCGIAKSVPDQVTQRHFSSRQFDLVASECRRKAVNIKKTGEKAAKRFSTISHKNHVLESSPAVSVMRLCII